MIAGARNRGARRDGEARDLAVPTREEEDEPAPLPND